MPIFEYICAECGQKFEKLVLSRSRAQEVRCPHCDSQSVDKAISAFGVSSSSGPSSTANCAPSG